jgi:hypothetical protein
MVAALPLSSYDPINRSAHSQVNGFVSNSDPSQPRQAVQTNAVCRSFRSELQRNPAVTDSSLPRIEQRR